MAASRTRELFQQRVRLILAVFGIIAALVVARLYLLQVVHGSEYRIQGTDQYVSTSGGFYNRGSIFFADKDGREVSAATMKTGYILAIQPSTITDPEALYTALSAHVALDEDAFLQRATKAGDPYEEVAHRLTSEQATALRAADLEGVILVPERWRYYPGGALAAHTIGFVAYEGDDRVGRYGLERYYDDVLQRGESNLYVNFFAELFTNLRDVVFVPIDKREGHIVTTIEPAVQLHLEQVLTQTRERWDSQFTAGIVIDPRTGAIRAIAVSPAFDLNAFGQADAQQYANPIVERVYEMGSIMKPLTMAAGIDDGAVTPQTTYNDQGRRTFDGEIISNFDGHGRGAVPMQEVLSQSLNTGVAFVVEQMGTDDFRRYMYRYGLNEETGVDLPGEVRPLAGNLTSPRKIEYVTASFGQGIAVSPINMVRALAALPDGYVEQPHIVQRIKSQNGISQDYEYDDLRTQVLDPETAEEITRMLVTVYDEALLDGAVKMEHYSIAAKTGTAQMASPDGGYYDDRYLHTFFGYFPAFDPQYLVFLMNVEPKEVEYASQTLTTPFVDVTQFLINYYDIPPDR